MPDPNEKEDEVLDDEIELEDGDNGDELEIDLDEADDADDKEKKAERDRNKAFASMRIENKELKETLNNLSQQVASLKPAAPAPTNTNHIVPGIPQTDAEWDALAEKDWKKAVDLRSIQNAQNIVKQQQQTIKATSTLDSSKQRVLAIHPELSDNTSEKSKIFLNILEENPDYLSHPKGPIYAMRDMEEYMENTLGYKKEDIRSAERKGAEREASRQNRIVLNKGGGRTNTATGNKVVLGKEELEFCKFQGIDPKEYARNKQKLSKFGSKEGVSI